MDAFQAARAAVPSGQGLEVRYEDVLGDPRGQVTAMLEFLGLRWTPEFEAGFSRDAFETGRREAYRRDLEPDQLVLLERSLAGHLQAHRYPTVVGSTQKAEDPDAARRFNLQSRGPDGRTHQ